VKAGGKKSFDEETTVKAGGKMSSVSYLLSHSYLARLT
jgi:hypothetical protein